ncbi:ROK family protein [Pseudoalteromonas sp. B160]|uniref:ROK family protein n=1 Tax=Pseudoalteromonas sp. B160 TaxID=630414 RepID=UPI00301CEED3
MTKQFIYGIDIGGSKIELAVFDASLKQLESWRIATPQNSYQDFLNALVGMILSADHKYQCHGAVGIGMPGIVNANQQVLSANVPHATGKNAAQDLAQLINRPVAIENDCRCFALSEARSSVGLQHTRCSVQFLVLVRVVGCVLMVNCIKAPRELQVNTVITHFLQCYSRSTSYLF